MMIEDFTKVPLGMFVSDARTIVRCPLCGRSGALEIRGGSRRCVHIEASMIGRDGLWVDPRDLCEWVVSTQGPAAEAQGAVGTM